MKRQAHLAASVVTPGVFIAIALVLGLIFTGGDVTPALADDGGSSCTENGIHYSLDASTSQATVAGINDEYDEVDIPDAVTKDGKTYTVAAIGRGAFAGLYDLEAVTGGKNITSIGDYAFGPDEWEATDESLTTVEFLTNGKIESIGAHAFDGCSSLEIPTGDGEYDTPRLDLSHVTKMGEAAFAGCEDLYALADLSSLTEIPDEAFSGDGYLAGIALSQDVRSIGDEAFYECFNMAYVNGAPTADDDDYVNVFPSSLASIGSSAFAETNLGAIEIPGSVTKIGEAAFAGSTLWEVLIDNHVDSPIFDIEDIFSDCEDPEGNALDLEPIVGNAVQPGKIVFTKGYGDTISDDDGAPRLQKAVDDAADGATITLKKGVTLSAPLTIPSGKHVTISAEAGSSRSVTTQSTAATMVNIERGASLTLDGDITWSAHNCVPTMNSGMFDVAGTLAIKGNTKITDYESGQPCTAPVYVDGEDAQVLMTGGSIAGNRASTTDLPGASGGVYVKRGRFFLGGNGSITKNRAMRGAAVLLDGDSGSALDPAESIDKESSSASAGGTSAAFTMDGGTIDGNAYIDSGTSVTAGGARQVTASAGAVYVGNNSSFDLKGGTITNNTGAQGGGITVADLGASPATALFHMTGGTVSNNHADLSGGGIYSFSNGVVLEGGAISDNTATGLGGGIYSEGNSDAWSSLKLKGALVKGNAATGASSEVGISGAGGGVWICPTGSAQLQGDYAVYDNSATNAGDDFAVADIDGAHGANAFSNRMLGGAWAWFYQDGRFDGNSSYGDGRPFFDGSTRYDAVNPGAAVTVDGQKGGMALKSVVDGDGRQAAEDKATLVITGNSAPRGGGIAMNGGASSDPIKVVDVAVSKAWNGGTPSSLKATLWLDGHKMETAELSEAGGWSYTFKDVPVSLDGTHATKVKVTEEESPNWIFNSLDVTGEDGSSIAHDEGAASDGGGDSGYASVTSDGAYQGSPDVPTVQTWNFANTKLWTSIDPPLTKVVTGDEPQTYPTFSFTMTARDGAPMPSDSADGKTVTRTLQSGADPVTVELGKITFGSVGTYVYDVREETGSPADGWTYDTSQYTLTVVVAREGDDLVAKLYYVKAAADGSNPKAVGGIVFTNSYGAPGSAEQGNPATPSKSSLPKTGDPTRVDYVIRCAIAGAAFLACGLALNHCRQSVGRHAKKQ